MKRILLGTAMAVAAMLSACQSLEQPNASVNVIEEDAVLFTASLGADTKTYIEYDEESGVYKNKWSASDRIVILARQHDGTYAGEFGYLVGGADTDKATFSGTLVSDHYVAYYGYYYLDEANGVVMPSMQEYQSSVQNYDESTGEKIILESYADSEFPMYAVSDDTNFEFKNLASILKVSLTGTDYIENVVFTPNDPTIAVGGRAYIEMDDEGVPGIVMANDSTAAYSVTYYLRHDLNESVPSNCYIVLPPQTYKGGFTITINSNLGSMTRVVNEDVTFERSQIRSLSPITYVNETLHEWSLIGSMSDWTEDLPMTLNEGQIFEIKGVELKAGDEFKFRLTGNWDVNFGAPWENYTLSGDDSFDLLNHGYNIKVAYDGIYDMWIDVVTRRAHIVLAEVTVDPVICYSFDEVAALPDETYVLVPGHVFGVYRRGFIFNIGGYYENCILVYQGTDQSMYQPVLGNEVHVYAYKTTYRGLPELYNVQEVVVQNDAETDPGYYGYWNLFNPQYFDSFSTEKYDYVKYSGTLQYSGNRWYVHVEGAEARVGSIEFPSQDLTPYIDQKVIVEGWFIGYSGDGKYVSTVLKKIYIPEEGGSTEDVIPGDEIIIPETTPDII